MLNALTLQPDAIVVFRWQHRIVAAQFLDEAPVARAAAVRNHDVVIGTLLRPGTGKSDLQTHRSLSPWFSTAVGSVACLLASARQARDASGPSARACSSASSSSSCRRTASATD